MEWIINLLVYLGITPEKLLPITLVVGAFGYLFNKNISRRIDKIDKDLTRANKDLVRVNNATTTKNHSRI